MNFNSTISNNKLSTTDKNNFNNLEEDEEHNKLLIDDNDISKSNANLYDSQDTKSEISMFTIKSDISYNGLTDNISIINNNSNGSSYNTSNNNNIKIYKDSNNNENNTKTFNKRKINTFTKYSKTSVFEKLIIFINYLYNKLTNKTLVNTKSINNKSFFIDFFSSFKLIYPVFILNFFFFLFSNFLNTSIISSINFSHKNNEDIIEAIGFTNTMLNVTIYPLYIGFGNILAILGSQAFGAKKYFLLKFILNQTRLFGVIFAILLGFVYLILQPHLGILFGVNYKISKLSLIYSSYRILAYFLEYEAYLTLTYLQIIEKGMIGMFIVITLIPILPLLSFLFITHLKIGELGAAGAGITFLLTNLILFVMLKIYTIFFLKDDDLSLDKLYSDNKQIYEDLETSYNNNFQSYNDKPAFIYNTNNVDNKKDSKYISNISYLFLLIQSFPLYIKNFNIVIIAFFDMLSVEMISYLAVFTPKGDYSAYIVTNTIYGGIQCFNMAYSVCASVNIGYFIGKGDYKMGKRYFYYLIIQTNLVVIFACFTCFLFKEDILNYLAEPGELWIQSRKLFLFALLINIQDASFSILFSTLKTLNENGIALLITVGYNFFNLGIMYLLAFRLKYGVVGLYYGFMSCDLIILLILIYIYFKHINWKESVKLNLEYIKQNELVINELEKNIVYN